MSPAQADIRLNKSLGVWPSDEFQAVVKQEIEQLNAALLPLQQGLSQGSYVADEPIKVMIIGVSEVENSIQVKAGIFYNSLIAGCNCADDPSPSDTLQEYCVVLFDIDQASGQTSIELITE